jgi:phosphohistidine phosphatase SixA
MAILIPLRHGKAEQFSESGRDGDRVLRDRGRAQAAWVGDRLSSGPWTPELILYSSLARADETAQIVADATGAPRERFPPLEFGHESSAISDLIDLLTPRLSSVSPIMIVGHNTQLEDLVGILANGPAGAGSLRLRTGEACVFDIPDPSDLLGGATLLDMIRLDHEA